MIKSPSTQNVGGGLQKANSGLFIVIEGTDGSGKGTQFKLLAEKLSSSGYQVETFDFPQYDQPSSFFVKEYLNGRYGDTNDIGPYTGSLFYALDRFHASKQIRKALNDGKIVLANRFTGSNMAHQGTKFLHPEERRGYFIWLDNLEFQTLKIPRPDKSYVLRVPADIAQKLVDKKEAREYTDKKRDIHEADLNHLKKSVEVYDDLCQLFPKDFTKIDCVRNDKLLDVKTIHDLIFRQIHPMLPKISNKSKGGINTLEKLESTNPYVIKDKDGTFRITDSGYDYLTPLITSTTGDVYAFTDKMGALTVAAAMARLSRRGDDMRVTILDEFTQTGEEDESLLERVITAYGDDSVQQLIGQHLVVENASNLLIKHLEWGRYAAYLEQSTRYIYFDQKDKDGKYKYFVPEHFQEEIKTEYVETLDNIFDLYSKIVRELTTYVQKKSSVPQNEQDGAWRAACRAQACDAARLVLPVATKSTVGIFASGQALEALIMRLRSSDNKEALAAGDNILTEARKVIPTFLQRADKPERGGATTAYLSETRRAIGEFALSVLPDRHSDDLKPVTLHKYWPKNEFDLVPHMLYASSGLSLDELTQEVQTWSYEQKAQVFNAYFGERLNRRHKPGRALEQAHYTWDLVCDYGIFRDLQRHRVVDELEWQQLTPRYGFDTPELIEEAGLTEIFERCFDLSAGLYSKLQAKGLTDESQYVTLLGHRMRWKVTYNAREAFHLHELRTSPQGHPGYRELVKNMHDKVAEVHPLIANAMIFVNKGEDPELTRLAAERYTQYKLSNF